MRVSVRAAPHPGQFLGSGTSIVCQRVSVAVDVRADRGTDWRGDPAADVGSIEDSHKER